MSFCFKKRKSHTFIWRSTLLLLYRAAIELDKEADGKAIRAVMGDMVGR